jgi:GntR family transcriptional repressor for pyruvate dehydrogenase complex
MNYAGGMAKVVVDRLLDDIAAGRYQPGSRLPTEPELCTMMGVSRATLREAMKALQQLGVTSIEQGRGTFVTPVERWSPFDPALLAARTSTVDGHLDEHWSAKLVELRRMVEVGVAGLAATRRHADDLAQMGAALEAMRRTQRGDVTAFAEADLAFHQAVMKAADNELIQALFDPIHRLIEAARLESSLPAGRRAHAIEAHSSILAAIESGDAAAASTAMRDHLDSTFTWVRSHAAAETGPATIEAGRP